MPAQKKNLQYYLSYYPARVVAVLASVVGLLSAILVPLANLDTSSVIGVVSGLGVIAATASTWLHGNAKNEVAQIIAGGLDTAVDLEHDLEPLIERIVSKQVARENTVAINEAAKDVAEAGGGTLQLTERPKGF